MFSVKPPPVMWDMPLYKLDLIPGKRGLMYTLVGVKSESPTEVLLSQGAVSCKARLERETILRIREKPLE